MLINRTFKRTIKKWLAIVLIVCFASDINAFASYQPLTVIDQNTNTKFENVKIIELSGGSIINESYGKIRYTNNGNVSAENTLNDNKILRGDGSAKGIQSSGIDLDDSDNLTGVTSINIDGTTGNTLVTDTDTFVVDSSNNQVYIGGTSLANSNISFSNTGSAIFNNQAGNADFTIKSLNNNSMLFVDASANKIGIANSNPNERLTLNGSLAFSNLSSVPLASEGFGKIFVNGNILYYLSNGGILTNLLSSNSGSLNGLSSNQFLRSDTNDSFTSGTLTFDTFTTLDVDGSARFDGSIFDINSNDLTIADSNISFDAANTTFTQTNGAFTFAPYAGSNLNINLSGTGDFAVNTNQLYVDTSTQQIGIGTSSPIALLTVNGVTALKEVSTPSTDIGYGKIFVSSADKELYFLASDSSAIKITNEGALAGGAGGSASGIAGAIQFSDGASGFNSNASSLFWNNTNGRLGIGTSSPAFQIHTVTNSASATRETVLKSQLSDSSNDAFIIGNATSSNGTYAPTFYGFQNSINNKMSLNFVGMTTAANDVSDSYGSGIVRFSAFITSSATDPSNGSFTNPSNRKLFSFGGVLDDGSQEYLTIIASGNVGIGSTTATGQLQVTSRSSTNKGLVVKSAVAQSANLTEWQDSSGNSIASVSADGAGVFTAKSSSSGSNVYDIGLSIRSAGNKGTINFSNWSGSASTNSGSPTIEIATGPSSGSLAGAYMTLRGKLESWVALYAENNSAGRRYVRFGQGQPVDTFGVQVLNDAGTAITSTPFSLGIGAPTNSFTIVNSGRVGIGETTPGAQIQVTSSSATTKGIIIKAAASQTANLSEWQNNSNTIKALIDNGGRMSINKSTRQTGSSLDVNGSIFATGFRLQDGSQINGYVLTSNSDGIATWKAPAVSSSSKLDKIRLLPATANIPALNPGALNLGSTTHKIDYDASIDESNTWTNLIVSNYSSGTVKADIYYSMASANTNAVIYCIQVWAQSDGDSADMDTESYDTANCSNPTTVPGTAGYPDKITITLTNKDSMADGDIIAIKGYRDADAVGDTATGDMELRNIVIYEE
jgi:hypothetical protein